jgi:Protein of unknown function (DUF1588)/PA14 domain/Protein of unknown function (DUF1592)/Cytochrome C oxidase, cbb3-type, subunit III
MNLPKLSIITGWICIAVIRCSAQETALSPVLQRGGEIYANQCAECHGAQGQGQEGSYDRPLVGDLSIGQLADVIHRTMPEGDPEACVGQDAQAVAAYIHQSFYSEAAQVRQRPPKRMFSRLTAEQLKQSLSDLYIQNEWVPRPENKRGLKAEYYRSTKHRKEDLVVQRIDPVINFDFGKESPGADIPPKDFIIDWSGGLKVARSGVYELIVRSTCSFTFHLGKDDRVFIDNHVQSGDKIEFRESIALTAGRIYPFRLSFIQRERKTEIPPARISVSWIVPGGVEQLIPEEAFFPEWTPAQYAIQAPLPPDDRSYGFERGIKVDRDWDAAVTQAALEFAQVMGLEKWPEYQRKHKDQPNENRQQLKAFLADILKVAYRYHLSDDAVLTFIDKQVQQEEDDKQAIKRALLIGLKSPRFLYPFVDSDHTQSQQAATRLALCLMDSLPVEPQLSKAIESGQLDNEEQIRQMAMHLIGDYRTRAKINSFLYEWLNITAPRDTKKKTELFGDFDGQLVQDLQRSLDAFIDEIVWSDASDYRQLVTADWGYTTPRIQGYYGADWNPAQPFSVALPSSSTAVMTPAQNQLSRTAGRPRQAGVLTHPYVLSRLAYFDSSSPIHRGVFVLRYLLGRTIHPPQDAAFTALGPDLHPNLTTRERTILQTSPEDCDGCHNRINSLGFTLENWDAVGRFRDIERNKPIDPNGHYTNRSGQEIQFANALELAQYLATANDSHQAFVRRAFQHFVKQPPAAFGDDALERLTQRFVESQFNIRQLIIEIAVVAAKNDSSVAGGLLTP